MDQSSCSSHRFHPWFPGIRFILLELLDFVQYELRFTNKNLMLKTWWNVWFKGIKLRQVGETVFHQRNSSSPRLFADLGHKFLELQGAVSLRCSPVMSQWWETVAVSPWWWSFKCHSCDLFLVICKEMYKKNQKLRVALNRDVFLKRKRKGEVQTPNSFQPLEPPSTPRNPDWWNEGTFP